MKRNRFVLMLAILVLLASLTLSSAGQARAMDNYGVFPTSACYSIAQANNNSNTGYYWTCWERGDGWAYLLRM
jgi:hypothetical protein